jgi:hypothetical protein
VVAHPSFVLAGIHSHPDGLRLTGELAIIEGKRQPATYAAVLAFIAGLAPVIYSALKMDEHLASAARLTGEYKNL